MIFVGFPSITNASDIIFMAIAGQKGMNMEKLPKTFLKIQERFGQVMKSLDDLGRTTDEAGPIDVKTAHLIQLAASTALRSEGAVHSHVKRALKAGSTPEEIRHALILLTPTIGFPTVAAALSWADDLLEEK
jgi:AhpD family alkylhydroperoxidase